MELGTFPLEGFSQGRDFHYHFFQILKCGIRKTLQDFTNSPTHFPGEDGTGKRWWETCGFAWMWWNLLSSEDWRIPLWLGVTSLCMVTNKLVTTVQEEESDPANIMRWHQDHEMSFPAVLPSPGLGGQLQQGLSSLTGVVGWVEKWGETNKEQTDPYFTGGWRTAVVLSCWVCSVPSSLL